MLNSPFAGLFRVGWRDTPHNIIERASGCLRALYGGNTEAIRSHHGDNPTFFIKIEGAPALGAGGWGVGAFGGWHPARGSVIGAGAATQAGRIVLLCRPPR